MRLPDAVSFEVGAILADCVATPFNAVVDVAQVKAGERVAVFGIGGLGTHAVQIARMAGAGFIAAIDPSRGARERARALGADLTAEPDGAVAAIRAATGGEGVDVSFDFVGKNAVLKLATASLAPWGRCILVGVSGERIELGPSILFAVRKTRLIGSYGYRRDHLELLARLVETGRLDLSKSISATLAARAGRRRRRDARDQTGRPGQDPARSLIPATAQPFQSPAIGLSVGIPNEKPSSAFGSALLSRYQTLPLTTPGSSSPSPSQSPTIGVSEARP